MSSSAKDSARVAFLLGEERRWLRHRRLLGSVASHTQQIECPSRRFCGIEGTVQIAVTRWSTAIGRTRRLDVLRSKGAEKLPDVLRDMSRVGAITTPDSLADDLRYASCARARRPTPASAVTT
jgi:hypothetical protein